MNQFDEFFNKKLNEEHTFDGQQRSWAQLDRGLQLYENGAGVASKSLALWKAVAAVTVLIFGALVWELQHLARENRQLKEAVENIEIQQENMPLPPAENNTVLTPAIKADTPVSTQLSSEDSNSARDNSETRQTSKKHDSSATNQVKYREDSAVKIPASKKTLQKTPASPKAGSGAALLPHPTEKTPSQSDKQEEKNVLSEGNLPKNEASETGAISDIESVSTTGTDSLKTIADVVKTPVDSLRKTIAPVKDSITVKPVQKRDSVAVQPFADAAKPPIHPVSKGEKRWRAGVHVTAGFSQPKDRGISTITGQGLNIAYRFWNNLSLTASADFLKFDVNAPSIPEECSDIKIPPHQNPGPHPYELKNISSSREIQQYSVGVNYAHKLIGRWHVTVQAAHSWSYLPSKLVSLKFEEMQPGPGPGPGGPRDEYFVTKTPKNWISNTWRLGAGLHYETPRWSFGVSGDYSKRMNQSRPSFDAIFASADVSYKF